MQIHVYCDESGTSGLDKKGREPFPTVYGYIASLDYWVNEFSSEWQAVLDEYEAPYFHFSEITREARKRPKNPYYGWNDSKVDHFLDDLAIVAGRVAIPCSAHGTHEKDKDPHRKVFELFFKDCFDRINTHWPEFNGCVDFFFEYAEKKWSKLIRNVANSFREKEKRLGEVWFPEWDDKRNGLPLQAADLLAYSQRQNAEAYFGNNKTVREWRIIDLALLRNAFPNGDRRRRESLPDSTRKKLIKWLRQDKETKDAFKAVMGEPPGKYYPFPVLKKDFKDKGLKLNLGDF